VSIELACPSCGEHIPVGTDAVVVDGDVQIEADLTDVWAHSWTHGEPE
jgi:hypothetical protein